MAGSYEKINYSLRPAKHIERKMMVEAFRRLNEFGSIESYRYIGFGSIYFSDFALFHKALGITNMLSIEREISNEERFKFNRPFRCIEIRFGNSNDILPTLTWDVRTILWLDYDGTLDSDSLADIGCFCTKAASGSVLVISVNANPGNIQNGDQREAMEKDLDKLKDRIGEAYIPNDIDGKQLRGWGTAKIYRRIINNRVTEVLNERNGLRPMGNQLLYKQIFNFHYADGAKMLTVGGIIYDEGQKAHLSKSAFEQLQTQQRVGQPHRHVELFDSILGCLGYTSPDGGIVESNNWCHLPQSKADAKAL